MDVDDDPTVSFDINQFGVLRHPEVSKRPSLGISEGCSLTPFFANVLSMAKSAQNEHGSSFVKL